MKCNIPEKELFLAIWFDFNESRTYHIWLYLAAGSNIRKQPVLLGSQTGCGSLYLMSDSSFVETAERCLVGGVGAYQAPSSHPESLFAE